MDSILLYLLKSGFSLALFYIIYWAFLKKETFFAVNRFYLLCSVAASFILPLIKLPSPFLVKEAISNPDTYIPVVATTGRTLGFTDFVLFIYFIGVVFFLLRFVIQLLQFGHLLRHSTVYKSSEYRIVDVDTNLPPFSFFGNIFIHRSHFSDSELDRIIAHERVHIRQMHSIDLILLELLTIIQWCNPFVWPYKRSLKETHEYLADAGVIAQGFSTANYQMLILEQFVGEKLFVFANNFNQSQIKRRLTMMTKHKSKKLAKGKVLIVAPLICLLVLAFAHPRLITEKSESTQPLFLNAQILPSAVPQDKAVISESDQEKYKEKYKIMKPKYEENRLKEKEIFKKFEAKKLDLKKMYKKAETDKEKQRIEEDMKILEEKRMTFKKESALKRKQEEFDLQKVATLAKGEEFVFVDKAEAGYDSEVIQKISYEMKLIDKKIKQAETKEDKKELTLKRKELEKKQQALKTEMAKKYKEEQKKKEAEKHTKKEAEADSKETSL